MNKNIFKSFRFEIVLYSLLSLFYTILTLAVTSIGIYLVLRYKNKNISVSTMKILLVLSIIIGIILFITYFLVLTKKFIQYMKDIIKGINEISQGNFENRIQIPYEDEFAFIAEKLNQMAEDIKAIMDSERRTENAKNELITSVAHDLRTPLTSIIGYLELVSSKDLEAELQNKYIGIAYNKSIRLEKLIDDLFTYTKFNFGEIKAIYTEVDMIKLIDQLLDEFYPSFAEHQLEYNFLTGHSSAVILADGDLLARAFANLISNAIKYGRNGKIIELNLDVIQNKTIITITNYGSIIPEADLHKIFQKFYRVENSRSSETGGSGLGLAIAQSIIEMHGGIISVSSNENGTIFKVELNQRLNIN